jgi:hypothetical protein
MGREVGTRQLSKYEERKQARLCRQKSVIEGAGRQGEAEVKPGEGETKPDKR